MPDDEIMDRALPVGRDANGNTTLLRVRGGTGGVPRQFQLGVLHPLRDGQPIQPGASMVKVTPDESGPYLRCETVYEAPGGNSGWRPMGVAQDEFSSNWDNIFGAKSSGEDDLLN